MTFFNRSQKQNPEMKNYEYFSNLGDNEEAWAELNDEDLKQVISVKFIEYGATQDGSRIAGLFALYRYAMQRLSVAERQEMVTEFSEIIEQHGGGGPHGPDDVSSGRHGFLHPLIRRAKSVGVV